MGVFFKIDISITSSLEKKSLHFHFLLARLVGGAPRLDEYWWDLEEVLDTSIGELCKNDKNDSIDNNDSNIMLCMRVCHPLKCIPM